jgi:hypothetical protein
VSVVVSFYRVINGVAGGPPDDAAELLGHLTLAEVQDELLSFVELEDSGEAALVGYPGSGGWRILYLDIGTTSLGLASAVLETMRAHRLTAFRWPRDIPIEACDPPIAFAEPRPPWQPEALAVATADGIADVPTDWGETRVLDSAEAIHAFLAGQ